MFTENRSPMLITEIVIFPFTLAENPQAALSLP